MTAPRLYELIRKIASGGMAQVWEGRSLPDGRPVAIKRGLPQFQGDPAIRRMFIDEARIASFLDHTNILKTIDFGICDDQEVIVMELIDGIDALQATHIGRALGSPMSEALALKVTADVALALDYAHALRSADGQSLGFIHRDVNPPNIILTRRGEVKLSDFGIARARIRQERTATGVVKGKQRYLAPEQAMGQSLTSALDVYLLGSTLHALIVGWPPLKSWQEMTARFRGGPLQLAPSLSPGVAVLISRCMELDPLARPTAVQAGEAARKLADVIAGESGYEEHLSHWLDPVLRAFETQGSLDNLLGLELEDTLPRDLVLT